jgi:NDP-sugar pyrophosphorylase family protein
VKAVILAAGEGTRLRPLTLGRPKPMIPVGPEPAIYYILSQLSREGFKEIVMVTGYGREQIMEYLGDGSKLGVQITYAVKPDEFICGTAGSLNP